MGGPDCNHFMDVAEDLFSRDQMFQMEMRSLLQSDCEPHAFSDAIARRLPGGEASTLRREFAELPHWLGRAITQNWAMADSAGKRFHLRSVAPSNLLVAARTRRVEFSVAVDEDSVTLELAHVPERHATWYAEVPAAVA